MKRFLLLLPLLLIGGLYLNWQLASASHDRDWQGAYSRLPKVTKQNGRFHVADIRNWDYAADGAIARQDWISRDIDPDTLEQAYFLVEPFGAVEAIAHTMMAFSFADGSAYVASIEARREKGEAYSAAKAAVLPNFEYMFVWTTERDMYGNSEFYAGDQLYLYPLAIPLQQQKAVLTAMLDETAEIEKAPRWYNTLFSNCTNVLARTVNKLDAGAVPYDIAWFLPGYSDEFLYQEGFLAQDDSFEAANRKAHISPLIRKLYGVEDPVEFSQALRAARGGK